MTVRAGDKFVASDDENVWLEVMGSADGGGLAPVRFGADGPTSTVAVSLLLDERKWKRVRSNAVAETPRPKRRLGDGLREIADMLDTREKRYGPAVESWKRIAAAAGVTVEQAIGVLLHMKRERAKHSPEEPDHLVDEIGYLAIKLEARRG